MEKKQLTEGSTTMYVILGILAAGVLGFGIGKMDFENFDVKKIFSFLQSKDSDPALVEDISASLEKIAQACQKAGYIDPTKCQFARAQAGQSAKDILVKNGFDDKQKSFQNFEKAFVILNGLNGVSPVSGEVYILPNKTTTPNIQNLSALDFSSAYKDFIKSCGNISKCLISTPSNPAGAAQGVDDFLKSHGGWSANAKAESIHSLFETMNNLKSPSLELGKYYMFASTDSLNGTEGKTPAPKISGTKNTTQKSETEKFEPEFILIKAENSDTFYDLFRKAGYGDITTFAKFINPENKNFDAKNNIWVWNDINSFDENSKPAVGKEYKIKNLKAGEKIQTGVEHNIPDENITNIQKLYLGAVDYIKKNNIPVPGLLNWDLYKNITIRESGASQTTKDGKVVTGITVFGTPSVGIGQITEKALLDVNKTYKTNFDFEDVKKDAQKNVIASLLYYSWVYNNTPDVSDKDYKIILVLLGYNGGAHTVREIYSQAGEPKNWPQMRDWMVKQVYGTSQVSKITSDDHGVKYKNYFTKPYNPHKIAISFGSESTPTTWPSEKFRTMIQYVETTKFPQN